MLTTDFSGTYDYEKEEADSEFDWFQKYYITWTEEQRLVVVEKTQRHWKKVLEPEGFAEFCEQWNKRAGEAGMFLRFFMEP